MNDDMYDDMYVKLMNICGIIPSVGTPIIIKSIVFELLQNGRLLKNISWSMKVLK